MREIGEALAKVSENQIAVDGSQQEVRDLQKSLGARSNTFHASSTPLADSLASLVAPTIAQHDMALPEFRAGSQSAADALAEARVAGCVGWQ